MQTLDVFWRLYSNLSSSITLLYLCIVLKTIKSTRTFTFIVVRLCHWSTLIHPGTHSKQDGELLSDAGVDCRMVQGVAGKTVLELGFVTTLHLECQHDALPLQFASQSVPLKWCGRCSVLCVSR